MCDFNINQHNIIIVLKLLLILNTVRIHYMHYCSYAKERPATTVVEVYADRSH